LEIQRVLKPDELPPCFVKITAMLRARKHTGERMFADREEERGLLDGRKQLDLLGGGERRELGGAREELLRLRLKILESLDVHRAPVARERHQRSIDEVHDVRFVRDRRI